MPLNRTKLRYGTIMLKAYEKFIWMTEFGAIIVIRNAKMVWKHEPNQPFFLYNMSSENY